MLPLYLLPLTTQHHNIWHIWISNKAKLSMVFLFRIILCIPCSSLSGPETINTILNSPHKWSLPEQCSNSRYICQTWQGDDLFEIDDVLVMQLLEDFNLPDGRDRELAPNSREIRAVNRYVFPNASKGILTSSRSLSMRIFLTAMISFVSISFAMNTCLAPVTTKNKSVGGMDIPSN